MKTLSATDALGPAFRRAREVMAAPFRVGFFLKIALVAALTQPSFYSVIFSYPLQGAQVAAGAAMRHPSRMNFASGPGIGAMASGLSGIALFVVFGIMLLIGLVFWVLATYLFCRLRFTLFDLVVYRQRRVREAWGKYGRQTWRYFGVMLLTSFVFLILAALSAGPFAVQIMKTAKNLGVQGANANPMPMIAQMLPFFGICLLLGLLWVVIDAILQDFILPPMAIEDASIEGSWGRFLGLLKNDPAQLIVYLLLRFIVAIGLSWVLMMVVFFILFLAGLAAAAVGFGLYRVMWPGGIGLQVVFVVIVAVMALALLVFYLLAMITVYGTAAVFKQSYAAYFFGSRYKELGERLEPPDENFTAVRVEPPLPPLPPLSEPPPVW